MAGLPPSQNINSNLSLPPAIRQSCSRQNKRVAFCNIIPTKDTMLEDMDDRPGTGCRSRCFACCTCACAVVFITLVVALIVGLISMALLRSTVPKITVATLLAPNLELSSSSKQNFLTADFNMTFEVTNKNDNVALNIRPLTVDVSSESINVGHGKTRPFFLQTKKLHLMNAYTSVVKKNIGNSYTEQFLSNIQHKQIIVDIELDGNMGVTFGGLTINGLPMTVTCKGIYQSVFEFGEGPKCDVRLFSFK